MRIYITDADYQEELRQKAWDEFVEGLPKCSVCGAPFLPKSIMRKITVNKEVLLFCEDCFTELEESQEIYY